MKLYLLLIILLLVPFASASDYYFSNSGDDSSEDGSIGNPWATATKFHNTAFSAGDIVHFKCGDTWNVLLEDTELSTDNGDVGNPITYTSYGDCTTSDNYPFFIGSYNLSSTDNWSDNGSNIWGATGLTLPIDIGQISGFSKTEDVTVYGRHHYLKADIDTQGDFAFEDGTNTLWVYSTSNPATYYENNLIAWINEDTNGDLIDLGSYIIIENMRFRFFGGHAVAGGCFNTCDVNNLNIAYGGGGWQPGSVGTTRYGNGIQVSQEGVNTHIYNNTVHDIYDAGITIQDTTNNHYSYENNLIEYNILYNNRFNWEYTHATSDGTSISSNNTFRHNTLATSGEGWIKADGQYPAVSADVFLWAETSTSEWTFEDNIFYSPYISAFRIVGASTHSNWKGDYPTFDYNLYYPNVNTSFFKWEEITYTSLSALQSGESVESNGDEADPLLDANYVPASNSPACTMSTTGSYVGALPCQLTPSACSGQRGIICNTIGCYYELAECTESSAVRAWGTICTLVGCS